MGDMIRMYLSIHKNEAMVQIRVTPEKNKKIDVVYSSLYSQSIARKTADFKHLKDKEHPVLDKWENVCSALHQETLEDITKSIQARECRSIKVIELPGQIEDYAFPSIKFYDGKNLQVVEQKDAYVTKEIEDIFKKYEPVYSVITGAAFEEADPNELEAKRNGKDFYVRKYCTGCKTTVCVPADNIYAGCDCVRNHTRGSLVEKMFKRQIKGMLGYYWINKRTPNDKNQYKIIQMNDDGFKISILTLEYSIKDSVLKKKLSVPYEISYHIGEGVKVTDNTKKSKSGEDVDILETGVANPRLPVIIGSNDTLPLFSNTKVMRACGFLDVIKYMPEQSGYRLQDTFCRYVAALAYYPPLEQLVKAGYYKIFKEMNDAMSTSDNKSFKSAMGIYDRLIDKNGTTSKNAVRIPKYIMEYLVAMNGTMADFLEWIDIYELTHITKEQFEQLINSTDFIILRAYAGLDKLVNILKYGYDIGKLLRYLTKTVNKTNASFAAVMNMLNDYLFMCETLGVDADKYPMDLQKQHNDIVDAYNSKQWAVDNATLLEIGNKLETCLAGIKDDKKRPKTMDDYVIVFPKCKEDFINEGNMQHNCVSSYADKVIEKRCYIYFLRDKNTPEESFITAEFTCSGKGQFLLSNNRSVKNEELIKIKRYIAKTIEKQIKEGHLDEVSWL